MRVSTPVEPPVGPTDDRSSTCVLCPPHRKPRQRRDGGVTCDRCIERLADDIIDIRDRFKQISPELGASIGGRRSPGFSSRPPLNLHNTALRDPRTAPRVKVGELHSPVNLLISWCNWIRKQRRQEPVAYPSGADDVAVQEHTRYLLNALDWVTRQDWVVSLHAEVRACAAQVRSATGERRPRPVGKCCVLVGHPDDPLQAVLCGHALFPPREGRSVTVCGKCGVEYSPLEQIEVVRTARAVA